MFKHRNRRALFTALATAAWTRRVAGWYPPAARAIPIRESRAALARAAQYRGRA